jgi:hypothetical protein
MRNLLWLAPLLLTACATGWPKRDADYWARFVEENPPYSDIESEFFPAGTVDRTVWLDESSSFEFKFVETVNSAPIWIMHVRQDHTGYFIFQERMQDGSVIRAREHKVEFTLSDDEYAKVRTAIIDSGFLSVRSNYTGDQDSDWSVGVRGADGLKVVEFNGGYPAEARSVVYGVYAVIVKTRTLSMVDAPVFDPEDWKTAPENQPLR